ncbi:hypothetical protein J8273_5409 [Carpediemonas membranifera]|uniref:Uncharacterized protein n=1 Tax=Carpediemonas membranifera TaxID=201153 RepID=A0A8J6B1R2_9EUKA|nr:hypothetical protein J8273_5409 [Carpediemonas membranifera]|eukprot:KAG9392419.1 hypothetical protein J8273_5409 [Carpediemonas membranifera]
MQGAAILPPELFSYTPDPDIMVSLIPTRMNINSLHMITKMAPGRARIVIVYHRPLPPGLYDEHGPYGPIYAMSSELGLLPPIEQTLTDVPLSATGPYDNLSPPESVMDVTDGKIIRQRLLELLDGTGTRLIVCQTRTILALLQAIIAESRGGCIDDIEDLYERLTGRLPDDLFYSVVGT